MVASILETIPILPYPPAEIRQQVPEWQACIGIWSSMCDAFLELPQEGFVKVVQSQSASILDFLSSYVQNASAASPSKEKDAIALHGLHQRLYSNVFLLIHRTLSQLESPPQSVLTWQFLGAVSRTFRYHGALSDLMESTWATHSAVLENSLQKYKDTLTKRFEVQKVNLSHDELFSSALIPLLRACPSAGTFFLAGLDLLDAILTSYPLAPLEDQKMLLLLSYYMLLAPLQKMKANASMLRDHLFTLRADAESKEKSSASQSQSLLSDLLNNTPFLARVRRQTSESPDKSKIASLISSIEQFCPPGGPQHGRKPGRRKHKGKGRRVDSDGGGDTVHIHRMSIISQVQDLFPDLGSAYVTRLLDEYNDNVERLTEALLEDSVPQYLKDLDHSAQLPDNVSCTEADLVPDLVPRPTPPPSPPAFEQRRNVFDNDEFDRLAVSKSQIHLGRKDTDADTFKQDGSSRASAKAAIMSALAAFDADDDERDDTYDLEDVGGTVDQVGGPEEGASHDYQREKAEETLFSAWSSQPALFGRDSTTRRGKERQNLKNETGMTDEAIEGWALMLQRDPGRLRKMEAKYTIFNGQQRALQSTSWRDDQASEDEPAGSGADTPRGNHRGGQQQQRGFGSNRGRGAPSRGHGQRRGGGGGGTGVGGKGGEGNSVSGPSSAAADDKHTQISRNRKEANKSSRANHNRRDQRARKVARAGGLAA